MKTLLTFISGSRYEMKSFAVDDERKNVSAYGVFMGTHTGQGAGAADVFKTSDYGRGDRTQQYT